MSSPTVAASPRAQAPAASTTTGASMRPLVGLDADDRLAGDSRDGVTRQPCTRLGPDAPAQRP